MRIQLLRSLGIFQLLKKSVNESDSIPNNEVKTKEDTNEKSPSIMDEKIYDEKTNKSVEDGNAHQVELDRKNIENPVVADKKGGKGYSFDRVCCGLLSKYFKIPGC
ncbi:hypothetical protein ACT7CN_04900 [Bacillus cereus]